MNRIAASGLRWGRRVLGLVPLHTIPRPTGVDSEEEHTGGYAEQRLIRLTHIWLAVSVLFSSHVFAQADWTQRSPAASPPARSSAGMAQLGVNVMLFGGISTTSNGTAALGDTWLWNGTTWSQVSSFGLFGTGPRPSARSNATMAYHPNANTIVLFGG